ncbi:MAG: ABC transporter ATP-binding protein [Gemmataceae bacterium]
MSFVEENDTRTAVPFARPAQGAPLLLFERVSKWYGPVIGVNQVTLELRSGITGLVGANGAGKSTLLRLATGQLRPDLGSVHVRGQDAWSVAAKRLVGYCPEVDSFYEEMSGRRFVECMARLCGYPKQEARRRTEAALELVQMEDRADRRLRGYSKGMRQRIKLAQALIHDPELLVLDEPLSGIDPVGRAELIDLFLRLAQEGKCLLASSHELDELEKLTDHVAIMAHGRIAAVGTLTQIRDLLDDHPLSIRIEADRPRELGGALLAMPDVVGVELIDEGPIIVRAKNPRRFFKDFNGLVLDEGYDIRCLETLDDSARAILGYLLGGNREA